MSLKRVSKQETILICDEWSGSKNLVDMIAALQKAHDTIPEEFRGPTATFQVRIEEEWHKYEPEPSRRAVLELTFVRPENDAELAVRQKVEDERIAAIKTRELAEFERLSKKFAK